jgi:hypothetical protein
MYEINKLETISKEVENKKIQKKRVLIEVYGIFGSVSPFDLDSPIYAVKSS